VILGVGSGHLKPEFGVLGADFTRRGTVSDEYIEAIAAAWLGEVACFEGRTVAFRDVMVSPRVARRPRPPIWVGGNSRAAVRRAARHADGWVPWELTPESCATAVDYARRLRAEAGKPDVFEVVAPLAIAEDAGGDQLLDAVARWRTAGATAFHVGVGAGSFAQHLARIEWFARDVMARVP
jgi:alkanesulfonate monooxygenase SsuD/methylene tetrahydromethanopterin reductase-like flavin-dependent oxidoreductase (luciferase family)